MKIEKTKSKDERISLFMLVVMRERERVENVFFFFFFYLLQYVFF